MRLAVLLSALALVAGCGGDPGPSAPPAPTSLAQLKPAQLDLARVGFCDLVPQKAVTAAVGGPAGTPRAWGNGDQPPVTTAGANRGHELGCAWSRGRIAARAWVFARPVSVAFARQVVATAPRRQGCTTKAAAFGRPGLVQICAAGGTTRVRRAGLFGDTWLTCEAAGPERPATVTRRADAWCVAVATTLDSGR